MSVDPFAAVAEIGPPDAMKIYVLMVLAVIIGTLFDVSYKRSGASFAGPREKSRRETRRRVDGARGRKIPC
jgi:hypothetical protein